MTIKVYSFSELKNGNGKMTSGAALKQIKEKKLDVIACDADDFIGGKIVRRGALVGRPKSEFVMERISIMFPKDALSKLRKIPKWQTKLRDKTCEWIRLGML
ncbi:MAG: hypothetical protein LBJ18_01285 [Rickettsiales bacterium]|jgi:hypothetical protein|nr:hypothetical protein [Rickettsiales bacterium]